MAAFHTYNGESLAHLLGAHGVRVSSATPTMMRDIPAAERQPGDAQSDIIWDVELTAAAPHLPCGLNSYFSSLGVNRQPIAGHGTAIFEVTQRGSLLPANAHDENDPLVYWLTEGKCLE